MNTETIDNIKMIAETAREFAEKNIRPNIMEWDESQTFPKDLFHQLGEMGFMGIVFLNSTEVQVLVIMNMLQFLTKFLR
jgi:alkylation response protein AidB-like acyl-CoA dehydrogenase